MAFQRFKNAARGEDAGRKPWATIEPNGSGFIMHLGSAAVRLYELTAGDRVFLYYDPEKHQIGVEKHEDGDHAFTPHGKPKEGSVVRLKVSITRFYRENLERYRLRLPFKVELSPPRGRSRMTFTLGLPDPLGDRVDQLADKPARGKKAVAAS